MIYSVKNLHKDYKMGKVIVPAVDGITYDFEQGKFYTVMGPSGSGKSTFLHMLGLLDVPTQGKVYFDNIDSSTLSENKKSELRNTEIGFIFQKYYLVPVLNVYENVELPLLQRKNLSKVEIKERVDEIIESVGLGKFKNHRSLELSGGQQQRVAIARALVTNPKVVIADEPTANLDSKNGEEIIKIMLKLNVTNHTTFIFSTHDPSITNYCDEVVRIKDGKFV